MTINESWRTETPATGYAEDEGIGEPRPSVADPVANPVPDLEMERLLAIGRLRQATLESWLRSRRKR